jgi:hypothetical protein
VILVPDIALIGTQGISFAVLKVVVVALVVACGCRSSFAQVTRVAEGVASGGGLSTSSGLILSGLVGDGVAGYAESATYRLGVGYPWQTGPLASPLPNVPPTAVDDEAVTTVGVPVSIPILANDFDLNGDVLAVTSLSDAANGSVVDDRNGSVTYRPSVGFSGLDGFTYEVTDGNGGTDRAIVTITVLPDSGPLIVWPGDTDGNGIVEAADVLRVGQYFEVRGAPRSGDPFSWSPEPAPVFEPAVAALADATGDGLVSQNDVLPIGFHYGNAHGEEAAARAEALGDVTLPAAPAGSVLKLVLRLENGPGIGREILGAAARVQTSDPRVRFEEISPGELIEQAGAFDFVRVSESGLSADFAYTRKRGSGVEARAGELLHFTVVVLEDVPEPFAVSVTSVSLSLEGGAIVQPSDTDISVVHPATVVATETKPDLPGDYALDAVYPNPFNPRASVRFALPEPAEVRLDVFDAIGRQVATLVEASLTAGFHVASWDAAGFPSGLYIVRLQANRFRASQLAVLLK